VRAPLVQAEQHGSIRIQDLTKVVMARRRLELPEERLVPFETAGNIAYADDRPCTFHRISTVGLTRLGVQFRNALLTLRDIGQSNQGYVPLTSARK
jgi:hypothetical protein